MKNKYIDTFINEELTFKFFGYTSFNIKLNESKLYVRRCDKCGKNEILKWLGKETTNICASCRGKKSWENADERRKELSKNNPFMALDVIKATIKRMININPMKNPDIAAKVGKKHVNRMLGDSNPSKNPKVIEKIRLLAIERYKDPEQRILASCIKQDINREDFTGFIINDRKYCSKFNDSLKTKIRNKYNNCDYISGIHKSICNPDRELDIHHIDYDKDQGCNGIKWKLIPLSRSNHVKTNGNRFFWNRLFIYALEYDKEYYET